MTDREKIETFLDWLDDYNSDESTDNITVTKAEILIEELKRRYSCLLDED